MAGRILVVDDDEDVLKIFQLLLKRRYDITTLADADGLLNGAGNEPFDLAIFDHRIRGVTSTELISFLKKKPEWHFTHFVLHSGVADLKSIADSSGADGFLPKPSSIDDILAYVTKVFEKRG